MALLASQLPGLMDMKVFYKGKTAGKSFSSFILLVGPRKRLGAAASVRISQC